MCETLVNGDRADILFYPSGLVGDPFAIHRGFVYPSSQGVFPWRGELLMQGGMQLYVQVSVGVWSIVCNGRIIPPYAWQV